MRYHMIAFAAGFLLDLLIGDPRELPHPVRAIGWLVGKLERKLNHGDKRVQKGLALVLIMTLLTVLVSSLILTAAYLLHPVCGVVAESVMTCQALAVKALKDESMRVYERLQNGSIEEARYAVSMIVGRDTECLDSKGIIKAAVETVAENTSDGVLAPMLYLAVGGPVLGFLYKAVNTMDSMIGYKNERYLLFGRSAARLDDAVNFLPARLCAMLMLVAAFLGGGAYDAGRAYRIYRRDRRKHASPNSAQTEAVCAGALGVQLAGDASYFGRVVPKETIGDAVREVEAEDIVRANRLLYITALLGVTGCILVMGVIAQMAG
ncbi:MAG: adenosylcobinamide-phosphate synthase CbiB [Butyrivibrio sp.]|nr:adenosylcobinamide-phosphate synthase CbiB [Butyrivibrio sp.]